MVLGHPPLAVGAAPPKVLGRVHSRYKTPHVSTIVIGAVATVWYVVFNLVSQNFLFDSLTALAIVIAFYYALTGFSCAIYYRHELRKSFKNDRLAPARQRDLLRPRHRGRGAGCRRRSPLGNGGRAGEQRLSVSGGVPHRGAEPVP